MQSRYYNPEIGRFLNADALTSTGQGLLGSNMFAYCSNNPSNFSDFEGQRPVSALERFDDTPVPPPPKERKVKYDVPLYNQGKHRLCWAFCQVMGEAYDTGLDLTEYEARQIAVLIAKSTNGYNNWDHGNFPNNMGSRYDVDNIATLYDILINNGPVYALYTDNSVEGKKSMHLVVVTGVNVRAGLVYTNNPWGLQGKQTFKNFLSGVAWVDPVSYNFKLSGVYPRL